MTGLLLRLQGFGLSAPADRLDPQAQGNADQILCILRAAHGAQGVSQAYQMFSSALVR